MSNWRFDVTGRLEYGAYSTVWPENVNDVTNMMNDWYNYNRQRLKADLQFKQTPVSISSGRWADWHNISFFVVANLGILLNLNKLYQYNQAFSTLYTYLPKMMGRILRLYRRAHCCPMPAWIVRYACKCGQIPYVPQQFAPHVRLWSSSGLVMCGGATSTYNNVVVTGGSNTPSTILATEALLTQLVEDIEKAIWVLEGNPYSTWATDAGSIRDMLDLLARSPDNGISVGLPAEDSWPGVLNDISLLNDWYCRGINSYSSSGTWHTAFPLYKSIEFTGRVPVLGAGVPGDEEFTLLGAPKYYLCQDDLTGQTRFSSLTKMLAMGTNHAMAALSTTAPYESIYKRRTGWTTIGGTALDLNDGTASRNWLNSGHHYLRNVFSLTSWAGYLGSNLNMGQFIDEAMDDYQIWVDEEDFCSNYALMLQREESIPYLR